MLFYFVSQFSRHWNLVPKVKAALCLSYRSEELKIIHSLGNRIYNNRVYSQDVPQRLDDLCLCIIHTQQLYTQIKSRTNHNKKLARTNYL